MRHLPFLATCEYLCQALSATCSYIKGETMLPKQQSDAKTQWRRESLSKGIKIKTKIYQIQGLVDLDVNHDVENDCQCEVFSEKRHTLLGRLEVGLDAVLETLKIAKEPKEFWIMRRFYNKGDEPNLQYSVHAVPVGYGKDIAKCTFIFEGPVADLFVWSSEEDSKKFLKCDWANFLEDNLQRATRTTRAADRKHKENGSSKRRKAHRSHLQGSEDYVKKLSEEVATMFAQQVREQQAKDANLPFTKSMDVEEGSPDANVNDNISPSGANTADLAKDGSATKPMTYPTATAVNKEPSTAENAAVKTPGKDGDSALQVTDFCDANNEAAETEVAAEAGEATTTMDVEEENDTPSSPRGILSVPAGANMTPARAAGMRANPVEGNDAQANRDNGTPYGATGSSAATENTRELRRSVRDKKRKVVDDGNGSPNPNPKRRRRLEKAVVSSMTHDKFRQAVYGNDTRGLGTVFGRD